MKLDGKEFQDAQDSIKNDENRAEFIISAGQQLSSFTDYAIVKMLLEPHGPKISLLSHFVTLLEIGIAYGRAQATRELTEYIVKKEDQS